MIIVLMFWVVCAGVAAFIANAKGREIGTFAMAGLLLGPFGVVWAACARTGEQRAAADQAALDASFAEAAKRQRRRRPVDHTPLRWPDDTK
jgi:hypothetical protein